MNVHTTTARKVVVDALVRVEDGAFAHIVVPEVVRRAPLEPRDHAQVTAWAYGTLRMQRTLDFLLAAVSSRPLTSLDADVRAALRLGAYQLFSGIAAHAAVGETVRTVSERARGFANGALRALARTGPPFALPEGDDVEAIGVRTSHPDWIVELLVEQFGIADALATLALDNQAPAVTLRVNPLRASTESVERELRDIGARVERGAFVDGALLVRDAGDIGMLPVVREGRATPQDQSSQAIAALLDPQPGERVLDVAAAPGGKATAAAEYMRGKGLVVAADLHQGRARTVARAATRLGLDATVGVVVADGRHGCWVPGSFDRVLLDAPCSGLGVLRRRPDARWRVQPDDVAQLAVLQCDMLASAANAVRPGGRLLYAVCTLSAQETIGVDAWAAEHLSDFDALPAPAAPWRPHGRGALLLPHAANSDGMFVLALTRMR